MNGKTPLPKGAELVAQGVYDRMYEEADTTYDDPANSQYMPMYRVVVESVARSGACQILEVGCGSGVLAEMLIGADLKYSGFDISPVGVKKAAARNPKGAFFVGDASKPVSYQHPYDAIVCCEVLEHIDEDRGAIMNWKAGTRAFCSVPNFDYSSHVRYFRTESEVVDRYADLIKIEKITRLHQPPLYKGMDYITHLRWAMMGGQWKRAAGMLGINRFSWRGGWFLFEGIRR